MIVAWHEVPGKRPPREPSRRVRYDRAQPNLEVFLVEMCPAYAKLRCSNHRIGAQACANQTVPYGTALLGGAIQALRARLRSHRPSGKKAIRPSKGLALS